MYVEIVQFVSIWNSKEHLDLEYQVEKHQLFIAGCV